MHCIIVLAFLTLGWLSHRVVLLGVESLLSTWRHVDLLMKLWLLLVLRWWHVDLLRHLWLLLEAIDDKLVLLVEGCLLVLDLVLRYVELSAKVLILPVLLNEKFFIQRVRIIVVFGLLAADIYEATAVYRAKIYDRKYNILEANREPE